MLADYKEKIYGHEQWLQSDNIYLRGQTCQYSKNKGKRDGRSKASYTNNGKSKFALYRDLRVTKVKALWQITWRCMLTHADLFICNFRPVQQFNGWYWSVLQYFLHTKAMMHMYNNVMKEIPPFLSNIFVTLAWVVVKSSSMLWNILCGHRKGYHKEEGGSSNTRPISVKMFDSKYGMCRIVKCWQK